VAVIDSGIDLEHEDLKDSLWTNPYPDQLMGEHGYDFTRTVPSREPVDDDGHGTHISGIIAASSNNQKGVRGVAQPNVKIMSLKASTDGNFSTSHEIKAFEYIEKAIKLGVNVVAVNCSYGGESNITEKEFYDDIFDKLGSLGAVTCVASGNEYADLDDHKNGLYLLPACTDSKYAITVAGVDEKNDIASFSNTSSKYVDIAAPGTNILSTVSYNSFNPSIYDTEQLDNTTDLFLDFNNESA
jgi:subtilisin family serine protease